MWLMISYFFKNSLKFQHRQISFLINHTYSIIKGKATENSEMKHSEDPTWRAPSLVDPELVLGNIALSPETFSHFLQGNYLHFFGDIDDVVQASSDLSMADYLMGNWEVTLSSQLTI